MLHVFQRTFSTFSAGEGIVLFQVKTYFLAIVTSPPEEGVTSAVISIITTLKPYCTCNLEETASYTLCQNLAAYHKFFCPCCSSKLVIKVLKVIQSYLHQTLNKLALLISLKQSRVRITEAEISFTYKFSGKIKLFYILVLQVGFVSCIN